MPDHNSGEADVPMLQSLLESAVDAILTINERGLIQTVNPATVRLFGWSEAEMIGQNVSMLMAEPHRSAHDTYLSNYLRTSEKKIIGIGREVEARRKDGTKFPMHLSVSEFQNNGRFFAGVIHDFTKRKEAEDRLKESEERLALVLDVNADGWCDQDYQSGTTYWSDGVYRIFGHEPHELEPSIATARERIHPEDLVVFDDALKAHKKDRRQLNARIRFRRKSGEHIWINMTGRELKDPTGKPQRFIATFTDVSEIVRQQEQLNDAARLETVGQLTGGIAHDFNNILTVVLGNLELLEMQISKDDQQELVREAIEASDMGAKLTERLLAFARRSQLKPESVNLNDIVLKMTELLKRTLGGQADLSTSIQSELWSARVDVGQVENAIMNLVINARDAMPNGGRVIVETKNVILDEGYTEIVPELKPGAYVQLTVIDTGVGMPPEVRERAFDPFYTTKQAGKGTGLGLSMVYGFARQSDGHTTIYSEPGQGTTVSIYLPAIKSQSDAAALKDEPTEQPVGKGQTILVVEDDPKVRSLTIRRVTGLGYHVISASNAAEALEVLNENDGIDLVFTDIIMPGGISGYELAEEIRRSNPKMRIVLTSGYAEELIHPDRLESDGLRLLRKPYRLNALAQMLAQAFES